MTGNVDPASIEMYKSVGFDGLLAKPFSKVFRRFKCLARLQAVCLRAHNGTDG
jgi:hypothetical protein